MWGSQTSDTISAMSSGWYWGRCSRMLAQLSRVNGMPMRSDGDIQSISQS